MGHRSVPREGESHAIFRGMDEGLEERMGILRGALVFRVEMAGDEEGMAGKFDYLHSSVEEASALPRT